MSAVGVVRRLGLVMCLCLLAATGVASAKVGVIKHWPNSPVRHFIGRRSGNVSPSLSVNLRGDFATTGNTLLTCPENVARRRQAARRRGGRAAEPCLQANNNDHNMVYVNADPSGGHFDSSSAALTIPSDARVVHAFLYWGADLEHGVGAGNGPAQDAPGGANPDTNTLWKIAQLRVGSGAYAKIDATAPDRNGQWLGIPSWYQQPGQNVGFAYQVRADVTGEVNAGVSSATRRTRSGNKQVTVTVANVQSGRGYNRHGGWTLLVAWESPTASFRNLTLFDGFEFVQVQGGQQLVIGPLDFTGFTTPASGNIDAHATVWAYEGDRAITGDYLALGHLSSTCRGLPHESDAAHPADNFFNSTISNGGVDVGGRTPDYGNQLGFDLATLNLPEGTIPNGATGASVCLGTIGDTYFFGGIAFDTLIRAPNVKISKVADHTRANPGDTVTYTTTVTNPQRVPGDPLYPQPTVAATNFTISDPLPSGLDFVNFSSNPGGACTYSAAAATISCNVGTLAPNATFSYAFSATVHASAQGPEASSVVNTGCYESNSEDQPAVVYNGCDDATIVVPPAPPRAVDLGLVKSVSADTVAPGDQLTWKLVATNYGPGTSTGFVLSDQLPPGVSFVSATATLPLICTTPAVGSDGSVVCTATNVPTAPAVGSSLTVTIVATVPAGTADGTLLTNLATVHGDQDEPAPDPHPNSASTETRVVVSGRPLPPPPEPPAPNPAGPPELLVPSTPDTPATPILGTVLALHKQANPSYTSDGAIVTFRLRIANIAENSALSVRVCDSLPRGLTVVSARGFRVRGRTLCTTIGRLRVLTATTVRFTARVSAGAPSRINVATAQARNARTVRAKAMIHVSAPPPPTGRG